MAGASRTEMDEATFTLVTTLMMAQVHGITRAGHILAGGGSAGRMGHAQGAHTLGMTVVAEGEETGRHKATRPGA